jgi:hypothetical protein
MGAKPTPREHGQAPRLARVKTDLKNIPGSKRAVKNLLGFDGRAVVLCDVRNKKKPLNLSGFSISQFYVAYLYSTTSTMRRVRGSTSTGRSLMTV